VPVVSSESVTVTGPGTVLGVYSKVRIIPVAIESYIVIPAQVPHDSWFVLRHYA